MLILGSQSKARYQLLRIYNAEIMVRSANIDETFDDNLSIEENVVELAQRKAQKILEDLDLNDDILICADTVVVVNGTCFNKPKDYEEAYSMIESLSNQTIEVVSGVYLKNKQQVDNFSDTSKITFPEIPKEMIEKYLEENSNYKHISGALDIDKIKNYINYTYFGSYSNIIGLPMERISKLLYDDTMLPESAFSTPEISLVNIYRSSVRTIVQDKGQVILLKGYSFDKKFYYYTTIGGGYHKVENKEDIIKKEAIEEGGLVIDNLKYLTTTKEYTTLSRYINYNKLTVHTYFYSEVVAHTSHNYVEYEAELLIGIEYFTLEQAIETMQHQYNFFKDKKYPIALITQGDLFALMEVEKWKQNT